MYYEDYYIKRNAMSTTFSQHILRDRLLQVIIDEIEK